MKTKTATTIKIWLENIWIFYKKRQNSTKEKKRKTKNTIRKCTLAAVTTAIAAWQDFARYVHAFNQYVWSYALCETQKCLRNIYQAKDSSHTFALSEFVHRVI